MLSKKEIKNIIEQERYKKPVQRLGSETLRLILKDRSKAREYAKKNIDKKISDDLKDEYIEMMVDGMQTLAETILEKRSKKTRKAK